MSVNWSSMMLKLTLGSGSLVQIAVLSIALEPYIGLWMVALALVPLTLLVMTKVSDAIPTRVVKAAHAVAVAWYVALSLVTVDLSVAAISIVTPAFALIATLLTLGLMPCVSIVRALWRGDYDSLAVAQKNRTGDFDIEFD